MQKRYPLSFCTNAWLLINKLNARVPTSLQHGVYVRYCDTNVMYAWTAAREVLADWRIGVGWLQQLNQRLTALNRRYPRTV